MNKIDISCLLNSPVEAASQNLLAFAGREIASEVAQFHRTLPDYRPTPLVNLSHLANHLNIQQLTIKDESQRFDLNAFKVLGASYAIAMHLAVFLGLKHSELDFSKIIALHPKYKNITFATATDGNHGRAVAWAARLFGCQSVVYMPKGSSPARLEAISRLGAQASITPLNYDDTVIFANQTAQENGWVLLQDTAWVGYEEIPTHIMQGYFTLVTECLNQEEEAWPTHVFLQAGVGSFAAAIVAHMTKFTDRPRPKFIVIEPQGAACFYESIKRNGTSPVRVEGDLMTIMAGLACGEPSPVAWDILRAAADAFLVCSDDVSRKGMKILGNPLRGDLPITSGESGAVGLGALFEILTNSEYRSIKHDLCLDNRSKVLLFSTEGDTDPGMYRNIVWG